MSVTPQELVFLQSITHKNLNDFFTPEALLRLINIIESQQSENATLKIQVQELRDEINRLKGEQGSATRKAVIRIAKESHPIHSGCSYSGVRHW